ncbi:MAG TPA: hypothetical protein VGA73_01275 [Candidatus Binatia bacterium]
MAEPVNRVVSPLSVDRAIAVDRERDRNRDREKDREEKKRAAPAGEKIDQEAAQAEADAEPADPKKGNGLDIKV